VSNEVYSYVTTMLAFLAARSPKSRVISKRGEAGRLLAQVSEQALNDVAMSQRILYPLRFAIFDSLYAFGIIKTGLRADDSSGPATGAIDTPFGTLNPLMPFAVSISPFNFLWDDTARNWRSSQFFGHIFRKDKADFISDPNYDLTGLDISQVKTSQQRVDDSVSSNEPRDVAREEFSDKLPDTVTMIEVYLREAQQIVTLVEVSRRNYHIVRRDTYTGRPSGPYHMLGYSWLSDTVLPIAPAHGWWEQWRELNEQEFDLLRQIKNEKTVVAFPAGAGDSAKIIREAQEHSLVTGINDLGRQVTFGGATEQKLLAVSDARLRFESASGLTDIRRGAQSRTTETATAISQRERNANLLIEDMQTGIDEFTTGVLIDWLHYMWNDPNVIVPTTFTDPSTRDSIDVTMRGHPQVNDGFSDAEFVVEVQKGSMRKSDTPLERANAIQEAAFLLSPTVMQLAITQGFMPDLLGVMRRLGEKIGRDDLESIFIPVTPQAQALLQFSQGNAVLGGQVQSLEQITESRGTGTGPADTETGQLMQGTLSGRQPSRDAGIGASPLS